MRALEHKARRRLFNRNIDENKPRFSTTRIVSSKRCQRLKSEVNAILNFYDSPDGITFMANEELAEDNRDRWKEIEPWIGSKYGFTFIVVRNSADELQAVAAVDKNPFTTALDLNVIATVPQNLGKNGKCRGAGTAAFEDAVFLCIRKGYDEIQLTPSSSAIPFYEKLGFDCEDCTLYLSEKEFPTFLNRFGGKSLPSKS
jgi:hypothetical protein